jgi:ABC-type multidrug transport system fused ATPase/permease subunit
MYYLFKNFMNNFSTILKLRFFILLLFLLFLTVLEFISLSMIPLIVKIFLTNSSDLILFSINFEKIVSIFPGVDNITKLIFLTIVIFSIKFFLYVFFAKFEVNFYRDLKSHFSNNIFNSYLNRDYLFFLNINSSIVTRNIINESENAVQFVICSLILCKEILLVFVISLLLILYDPIISTLSLLLILFVTYLFYLFTHRTLKKISIKRIMAIGELYKIINETFSLIKEIKILAKEKMFFNKFNKYRNYFDQQISNRDFIVKLPKIFFEYLAIIALSSFILYFIFLEKEKDDLFIILSLVAVAIVRLMPSFNQISGSLAHFGSYKESFLILQKETFNLSISKKLQNNSINYVGNLGNIEIIFKNVFYDYSSDVNKNDTNLHSLLPVIKNVSFEIKKGEFIGIIGKSGSGKSTLINLILGLLAPKQGNIKINNSPDKVGYVPQDIYLIDDTLKANIALGYNDEEIDLFRIHEILKDCELESFVKGKKRGLDLILGDKGIRISGGEKQRVGLARTLYENKNIIIFDEATSSLDSETERSVMKSILNIKNKKKESITLIMIAHRLSSLINCDRVILLEDGIIKDIDTLKNLVKKYPEYKSFAI